jgi:protoheme ferro-lyase
MKKEYLLLAMFALFVWASRDKIPAEYQFWKKYNTDITVQNNSGQDLTDVVVVVWSDSHPLGTIKKDKSKRLKVRRVRDHTDVFVRFKYGTESIERLAGTLDEESDYSMTVLVNFAGVVTSQVGSASGQHQEDSSARSQ